VYKIETRMTRSALEAALEEARLIRELKPPFNRQLKSAAPAFFVKLDMMDEFPRVTTSTKMTTRRGVMHLGPFIGRRSLDHSVRALSRILGLRTCAGRLEPHNDFSPCIYGQMGHCTAPCNVSIGVDGYGERVRRAVSFLRGRAGPLLGELAKARDQAAAAMRFEEAGRFRRDLEALTTLAHRATRLSQVVTENNLVIVTGENGDRAAHVILAGRLAMTRMLDDAGAAQEVAEFVAGNYERFNLKPVERGELEAMSIVARWLRERPSDEGQLVYLSGPDLDPGLLA
jgi:excinuclease UvrABC nuclease subunit